MKRFTLLLALFAFTFGYSQNAPIDFETGGHGATWTWTVFENNTNPALEIIANPVSGGINTSATVAKFTALIPEAGSDGMWAGFESQHGSDIGTWTPTAGNSSVTVMVYQVGFTSDVFLKFATPSSAALGPVSASVSAADEWVELTFDMSDWIGTGIGNPDQIIFHPDPVANRTSNNVIYIDNITFSTPAAPTCSDGIQNGDEEGIDCGGSCGTICVTPAPLVSAPLSTTPESDVIWIYSDVYTNTANQVSFNDVNWANGASNIGASTEEVIAGTSDNIRYITDINVLFANLPFTDVSTFNYFHVDIWSSNSTFTIVKWESGNSPESGQIGVTLTPNQWTGVDINLNAFEGLSDPNARMNLGNFIIDASAGNDYYFDNLYFSKTAFVLGTEDFAKIDFKVYPNPTENNWTVRTENVKISTIKVFDVLGKQVLSFSPNTIETKIDGSSLKAGLYFAQIKTETGTNSIKLVRK